MSSQNYMQIMKEKFAKNKNPRDAILIAKAYFRAGNYEKSKEWALRANSLDKNLEESWIVFAKSKQMLGQRDEALNILITYYKKSRSKRVKELIEKIKTESI
jgi:tetratricopeptide (TPR) repeat protein